MSVQPRRDPGTTPPTGASTSLLENISAGAKLYLELSFRSGVSKTVTGTVDSVSAIEIETSHLLGRSMTIAVESDDGSHIDQLELNFLTDPNSAFFTPTDAYLLADGELHWSCHKVEEITATASQ